MYKSALKDTDPVKHKLDKGEVSLPPNSEEKVRELWEELMENSCLDLLGTNGILDAFYRQLYFTRLPVNPGHSSKINGVN